MATTRPVAMAGLDSHPNDDGLFGPQSVSWRAFASPASAIGVATAVLMQMIHPRVVRMIDQASNVRNDPAGRAAGTSQYGITIIYGDTETAERAGESAHYSQSQERGRSDQWQDLHAERARPADVGPLHAGLGDHCRL